MFVKRYVVDEMSEAMEKIRKELGPDAIILSNRPIRKKGLFALFQKKQLEVMAAYEPNKIKNAEERNTKQPLAEQTKTARSNSEASVTVEELNEKLNMLKNVVEDFTQKVKTIEKENPIVSSEVLRLYDTLLENDVTKELAEKLAEDAQSVTVKKNDSPQSVVEQLILENLGETVPIKLKKYKTNVILFIGPTGVGKTTTLVKIAGLYTCKQGLKVGLINTDTYRIAAQEQIRTYSEIMNIPLYTAYTPQDLTAALKTMEDRDVILIDTAGKSPADESYKKDIETLIEKSGADEILLTLSASTSFRACKDIISNYSFIKDYKMIITKTDETSSWGNILNIVHFAQRPLTYITLGQSVPDDIEQADMSKITKKIMGCAIV